MARSPGPSSAPPPPSRPPVGHDALSSWLDRATRPTGPELSSGASLLLRLVTLAGGPMQINDLQKRAGLGFREFAAALGELQAAKLVAIDGAPGGETVGRTAVPAGPEA